MYIYEFATVVLRKKLTIVRRNQDALHLSSNDTCDRRGSDEVKKEDLKDGLFATCKSKRGNTDKWTGSVKIKNYTDTKINPIAPTETEGDVIKRGTCTE